jgi:hypothetical protein
MNGELSRVDRMPRIAMIVAVGHECAASRQRPNTNAMSAKRNTGSDQEKTLRHAVHRYARQGISEGRPNLKGPDIPVNAVNAGKRLPVTGGKNAAPCRVHLSVRRNSRATGSIQSLRRASNADEITCRPGEETIRSSARVHAWKLAWLRCSTWLEPNRGSEFQRGPLPMGIYGGCNDGGSVSNAEIRSLIRSELGGHARNSAGFRGKDRRIITCRCSRCLGNAMSAASSLWPSMAIGSVSRAAKDVGEPRRILQSDVAVRGCGQQRARVSATGASSSETATSAIFAASPASEVRECRTGLPQRWITSSRLRRADTTRERTSSALTSSATASRATGCMYHSHAQHHRGDGRLETTSPRMGGSLLSSPLQWDSRWPRALFSMHISSQGVRSIAAGESAYRPTPNPTSR